MIEKPETPVLDAFAIVRAFRPDTRESQFDAQRIMNQCLADYDDPGTLAIGFGTIAHTLANMVAQAYRIPVDEVFDIVYRTFNRSLERLEGPDAET